MDIIADIKKLDFAHVTSLELNLLKTSNDVASKQSILVSLFDKKIFPYIVNKGKSKKEVKFFIGSHFRPVWPHENAIRVAHRSRGGVLIVDNGYYGKQPEDKDYYTIIKVNPDFTNEHYVYNVSSQPTKSADFNKSMLDKLAKQIISVWDTAIENNARNWGSG